MTLYLYLAKQFSKWFAITIAVFGSVFALIDFLDLLRRATNRTDIPITLLLKMLTYRFPGFFQEILPFVTFFAAILCFWRLNKNSELVVMRAAGVSIWQMLSSLASVALLIGALDVFAVNPISSKLLERFFYLEDVYFNLKKPTSAVSSANGLWFREMTPEEDGYTVVRADHFEMRQGIFSNIQVMRFGENEVFLSRIDGDIAHLKQNKLKVENGWSIKAYGYPKKFSTKLISTDLTAEGIKESFLNPRTLNVYQLRAYGESLEKSGLSAQRYFLYWHALMAKVLWIIVMVALAATFSLGHMRSGKTAKLMAFGIVAAFILYFIKDIASAMGVNGQIPIIVAAWMPTLIAGLLALTRLLYVEEG